MADVVVTCHIPGPGLSQLRDAGLSIDVLGERRSPDPAAIAAAAPGCRAMITMLADPVDAALLDAAGDGLRVVANYAVGFNNIDVDAATERGIAVTNTPGVLTDATAELAIALLLGVARRVVEGDRLMRAGGFDGWAPSLLLGTQLAGKTFGVVGGGRIGQATGKLARALGMRVVYSHRRPLPEFEAACPAERWTFDDLVARADVVSLHVPLVKDTHHLIGAAELARMRETAILINTARGPVVDEAALVEALRERSIGGAGLDVYEREPALADGLAALDNALLLPHVGSGTVETRAAMSAMTADGVLAVLDGRRPANLVDDGVWAVRRGR